MFLDDLGIDESGLDKLIKEAYALLGLNTFFTVGADEVRAWTFKKGMNAKLASRLTKYKIDIKNSSQASELGITFRDE